jgi:hypothetical protein
MASQNAKMAAKKVLENYGKGKKINMGKILREVGYSDNTADNPRAVMDTESYRAVTEPVVKRLEGIRNKLIASLEAKDLTEEKAKDSVDMMAKITHDIQLLSGKATEKTTHSFTDLTNEELEQLAGS